MKKIVLFLAVVFSISIASAQVSTADKAEKKPTPEQKREMDKKLRESIKTNEGQANNPNAPVIEFDKTVHDYGEIMAKSDGKCEFKFTNKGKEPLILSNVRSSCGCTVPEWPRQPILPGQSNVIKVKYDTKRVGTINKSIQVYSNAKKSPIALRIKGKVLANSGANAPIKSKSVDAPAVRKR